MKTFKKTLLGLAIGATALVGAGVATVNADHHGAQKVDVGLAAPNFTLTDMNGASHSLSDFKGKTVVLMWWSPQCPFVVKHFVDKEHLTFNTLYDDYASKDVVFLAINSAKSSHPYADPAANRKVVKEWKFQWPVLNDPEGAVGKMYGAKRTPEMFIINSDGVVAYHGAIDNDASPKSPGDVNYVRQALDEILAGESVSTTKTKPYGCSVKY